MTDVAYDPLRYSQAGEQSIDRLFTGVANRRAGRALQQGNYQQAAGALFGNGDIQGGLGVQNLQAQQQAAQKAQETEQLARQVAFTRQATTTLRRAMNEGADPVAAFDSFAPAFSQLGIDPQTQATYRQALMANPTGFLDTVEQATAQQERQLEIVNLGGGNATVIDQATGQEVNRISAPRPDYTIGTTRFSGETNEPIAQGYVAPEYIQQDPTKNLLEVAPGVAPSTMGGGGTDVVSAMIPITLQSESQNQDFDAQGNVLTSPAGAQGRMQVMPGTNVSPGYGVTPARDGSLEERARVGRDYLAAMMRTYGNDPAKAWAAYNWGPGNLDRAIQQNGDNWFQAAPAETQQYVRQNLAALSGGAPQAGGAPRQAGPRVVAAAQQPSNQGGSILTPQEVAAAGLNPNGVYQRSSTGQISVLQAAPGAGRQGNPTEAQNKDSFNANRMSDAGQIVSSLERNNFDFGRAQAGGQFTEDYRRYNAAALEWADSLLRLTTGAAATRDEVESARRSYFPVFGDSPAVRQQKAQRRAQVERDALARGEGGRSDRTPNSPQAPGATGGRQTRTNAPGLPFNITPQQLQFRQQLVQGGQANVRAPRGDRQNPIYVNPADEATSYGNIRPGSWFVAPDGSVLQKPPSDTRRRRR